LRTEIVVLSAWPERICRRMKIDLKRPQEREDPHFLERKRELLDLLESRPASHLRKDRWVLSMILRVMG